MIWIRAQCSAAIRTGRPVVAEVDVDGEIHLRCVWYAVVPVSA
jgi:hypothetical protein